MHDDVIRALRSTLDLSQTAAKIYLFLLEGGRSHVSAIARHIKVPRTSIYSALQDLESKNIISERTLGRKRVFTPIMPDHLPHILQQKMVDIAAVQDKLVGLAALGRDGEREPIQYFLGSRGIEIAGKVFLATSSQKVWRSFENPAKVFDLTSADHFSWFNKERIKRKIRGLAIVNFDEHASRHSGVAARWVGERFEQNKAELREVLVVSSETYPINSTIVTDGTIAMVIGFSGRPFTLIIEDVGVAQTFATLHEMIWSNYHPR